jgi:hypothetical protein
MFKKVSVTKPLAIAALICALASPVLAAHGGFHGGGGGHFGGGHIEGFRAFGGNHFGGHFDHGHGFFNNGYWYPCTPFYYEQGLCPFEY